MPTLNPTPGIPGVPNPTPSSTQYSSKASTRAPIYNPFDKFTQPEFDSWIGDITSALKRALGHEPPQPVVKSTIAETVDGDVSGYDEGVEDSFAEVMARRRVREKADASGVQEEIYSDRVHAVVQGSDEDAATSGDASSEVSSEEAEEEWIAGRGRYGNARDLNSIGKGSEEVIVLSSDEDGRDEPSNGRSYRSEDEGPEGTEEDEHASNRSASEPLSPPRTTLRIDLWTTWERTGHHEDEEDGALDELAGLSGEEDFPPKQSESQPPVLSDPWVGPSTFAEDFYSGGDSLQKMSPEVNPHLLPAEMGTDQVHEIIDDEDYDEFPPATEGQPVDISDPWSGPRVFAEDFYSGGDIREDPSLLSPSRLTPLPATLQNEDGTSSVATPGIIPLELGSEPGPVASRARDAEEYENLPSTGRTRGPSSVNEFIAPDLDDLYAELDTTPAIVVPPERETDREGSFDVSGLMKPIVPSPNFRAPSDRASPPPRPSLTGHVDWNWPPAFSAGRPATQSGHLAGTGEEALDNSDGDDEEVEEVKAPTALDPSDTDILHPESNISQVENEKAHQQDPEPSHGASHNAHTPDKAPQAIIETTSAEVPDLEREEALYTDFGSYIEDDGQDSTSYEPVSDNIDFGDLPPPPSNLYESAPTQQDVLSILSQLEGMPDSRELVSHEISTESRKYATHHKHSSEGTESAPPPLIEQVEEEVHGTFSMPSDVSEELPYIVVEVEGVQISQQELVDITSYAGDSPAAPLEFTVEEPSTEGRRTEEPEVLSMEPPFVTPSSSSSVKEPSQDVPQSPKMPDALSAIREITSHSSDLQHVVPENDSEDEQPPSWRSAFSRRATLLESRKTQLSSRTSKDSLQPFMKALVPDPPRRQISPVTPGAFELVRNEIIERASSEDSIASSSPSVPAVVVSSPGVDQFTLDATISSQAPRMFDSGIPMPVSADPCVPDPASFTSSPSQSSPALSESTLPHDTIPTNEQTGEAMKPSAEAISEGLPPSLLRHIEDRSISGLFTPMSDGAVSSDSSAGQDEVNVAGQTQGLTESESADVPGLSLLISGNEVESLPLDATQEGEKEAERGREPSSKVDTNIPVVQSEIPSPSVSVETIQDQTEAFSTAPEHSQEPATQQASSQSETLPSVPHIQEDHVVDNDAEGEPDPEYHDARGGSSRAEPKKQGDSAPIGEKLPEPTMNAPITTLPPTPEPTAKVQQPIISVEEPASPQSVSRDDAPEADVAKHPVETIPTQDVPETEPAEVAPSLKRKRTSPPPTPKRSVRLTSLRTRQSKLSSQEAAVPAPRKGKGKEKALRESSEDEDKEVRSILSTQGSESISTVKDRGASRTRATSSQPSSRSSSVVSSVPEHQIQPPPVPLIHAHGVLHHNHQRPGSLQPPSRQGAARSSSQPLRRQESLQNPPRKSRSPSLAPQSASQPALKTTIPTSTLVTRSNCRFHKISIPLEEDGPRVFFVVPGCSLSKIDLLKEEEIEDHGVLAVEENSRLVPDVEGLEFSSYLVVVLRQLVGTDYLRETEVFYLPQPGENICRKPRKTHKPKLSVTSTRLAAGPSSPHHSQAPKRSPVKPPLSKGESVSTASSFQTRRGQSNKQSISSSSSLSDSWLSEDSDIGEPVKRPKVDQPPASALQNLPPPSPSFTVSKKQNIVRRSKRLGVDASAYKPDEHSSGSSSEGGQTSKANARKKNRKRGTKRSRTSEGASGDEGNDGDAETTVSKKRRMRLNTSGSGIGKSST